AHITFAHITQHSRCYYCTCSSDVFLQFLECSGPVAVHYRLRCCHRKMEHRRISD
ncbi:hypothetical protein C0J52_26462, partial [Blattella germanica]